MSLAEETGFEPSQIIKINTKFWTLDQRKKGFVSVADFIRGVPNLDKNPIAIPILRSLTQVDGEEESKEASERTRIDFRLFVTTMALF